jgi:nicotinate-nucleotide adenylyltransferase
MPERTQAKGRLGPVGVMGGTFDPVHFGHLRLAQEAACLLDLEQVRWIPAGQPWHRAGPLASAVQRLHMVRLAIAGNARFSLDDAEIRQTTPSYTVETLIRLREELGPDRPLVLLLGADSFGKLDSWKRWPELFGLAHIFVAHRPGHDFTPVNIAPALSAEWRRRTGAPDKVQTQAAGTVVTCGTTALDISATAIRTHLAQGRSPRYLLPGAVLDYIEAQCLYTQENASA